MFAAALAAWAGAAVIVLADGRRGLAVGIVLVAAGFGVLAGIGGDWLAAALLFGGGAVCAIELLRGGRQDWRLMPPGSTARLIMAVVGGILSLWLAASVTTGSGAPLRFASIAVMALMAGRLLQGRDAIAMMVAAGALALAVAGATALAPSALGLAPYAVAALISAGAPFLALVGRAGLDR